MTNLQQGNERVPPELRLVIQRTREALRTIKATLKTVPVASNSLVGFELMVQGYAMLTEHTEEHSRDVVARIFVPGPTRPFGG